MNIVILIDRLYRDPIESHIESLDSIESHRDSIEYSHTLYLVEYD